MPTAERYHQYEILRREDGSLWELGSGAMGITYKAYDTNLRFPVALKVINAAYLESETARQRFLREARAAAGLRHQNVASVFNLGTEQDKYFYVMEFIDGETVEACVKRKGPMDPVEALSIALQVARALAVAAKQQLVHRDLKPSNLMLVDQEGDQIVKVIDFGLAKVARDTGEDSGALTIGGFVGTPHFASPEQIEEGEVDIRSDIYSLGVTLYFVLTGQSPFSGSIGQVMSQQLYKALPTATLAHLPGCVISLLQRMMEKDRNNRPQTPQDLQKGILACLQEIRPGPGRRIDPAFETASAFETIDLGSSSSQPIGVGTVFAQNYKLTEELAQSPQGRHFLADDLRRKRKVSILLLSRELLSDTQRLKALEEAVRLVRNSPHPMLREIYSFETLTNCPLLVQESVSGPTLLDILRARSVLKAPEVVRLINLLAPLADHANRHRLEQIDLTLLGIHLTDRISSESGLQQDFLRRPLTDWELLEVKVSAINSSFSPSQAESWAGAATRTPDAPTIGPPGGPVRLLSLLGYELLGGPRPKFEATGQYTPVAALTQEGNAALRRAMADACPSAEEFARQLAAAVGATRSAVAVVEGPKQATQASASRVPPTQSAVASSSQPKPPRKGWRWIVIFGFVAFLTLAFYLVSGFLGSQQIPSLSIHPDPAEATVFLDGKPPDSPLNTFTHVPFGTHQLSAFLTDFEPLKQEIQIQKGAKPDIRLQLKPIRDLAGLSIMTEPAGALILLDDKPPQTPPNTFTHVPFGTHKITATLEDYEPIRQDIQIRKGMAPQVRLQLKPIQEIGTLSITTEPSGASILLDGKPPQSPPNTFTHVSFGTHEITAALDDYEPVKQDILIKKGTSPQVRLQLKPIQEIAKLSFMTDPSGAAILLDGKPPQSPPNNFTHVPFGTHEITAALDGYETLKQDFQVRKGMGAQVNLQLKPVQEVAALSIITEPAGASISLDGKPPQSPPNNFTHVPFGSHEITATLLDYLPTRQQIEVHKGMSPEVRLQLKADPVAVQLNTIKKTPEGSPEYLAAEVRLVQLLTASAAPSAGERTQELVRTLETLRTSVPPIGKEEFNLLYRDSVKDAASLDLVPALLWLGENEKLNEAANLFLRAAKQGDSYGMMRLGRLYLRKGTEADDAEGFKWLNRAFVAPNPNLEAGAFIADCYLSGKGTKQDVQKAEEIVTPLADQSVVPAMTLAGRILQFKADKLRTEAGEKNNSPVQKRLEAQAEDLERRARQWWERAESHDRSAAARLGKYYEEGWGGVEKNEAEAEKRYKEGSDHGNALSMFFYGLFLEKKPGRKGEAQTLLVRAASLGLVSAAKWCKENNVLFQQIRADEDRQ